MIIRRLGIIAVLVGSALLYSCGGTAQEKGKEDESNKDKSKKEETEQASSGKQGAQQGMAPNAAQTDVSDQELETYIEVSNELRPIQMEAQKQFMGKVQNSDMGMERYQKIAQSKNPQAQMQQQGQQQSNVEPTDAEEKEFKELQKESKKVRENAQAKMKKKVEEKGMEWQRFREIGMAIRQDKGLQEKYKKIQQSQMQQQQQQAPQGGGQ